MIKLTQERLKEVLHYSPETGEFTWLVGGNGRVKGDAAGGINKNGYVRISIDGKRYRAHRLPFLYMDGALPERDVDHKNHIRHDNRWLNLRLADSIINGRNQKKRVTNTSGKMGVSWSSHFGKWMVQIGCEGKNKTLGYFLEKADAIKCRCAAEKKYGYHKNHGIDNAI